MSKHVAVFVLVFILALAASSAFGATYYVATTGADTNPGTSGSPWRTLQHAVDTIANGDTILVKPGTYVGCRMQYSGAAGAPKTLRAETAGTVTLNAEGPINPRHSILQIAQDFGSTPVEYWVVDGFVVTNSARYGIDPQNAPHLIVRNCTVHNSAVTGINGSMSNYMLIENNTSYSNSEHGYYMNNSSDYGIQRNNISYSNTGCGFHHNGDISVQPGDGQMSYWLDERNAAYLNGSGSAYNCDGVSDSKFINNLAYNNNSSGISLYAGDAATGSSNDLVYNNTFCMPSPNGRWAVNIPAGGGSGPSPADPTGHKIKNNILYSAHTWRGSISIYSASVAGFESDYNVVTNWFSADDGNDHITFSDWRSYGYDAHSILCTDPTTLFVNFAGNDFHLKAGAPAIDAGTVTSPDVTKDKDNLTRPQGAGFDIGCYEYASGVLPLSITTTSLPGATVSVAYSQTLGVSGGVTPYTWSLSAGSLPAGLSFDAAGAVISGTPTATGASSFTVRVVDGNSPASTATKALSIAVSALPLQITTPWLRDGYQGTRFSQHLVSKDGVQPATWSVVGGALPAGLSLNTSTGEISGTPSATGASSFTVRATDSQSSPFTAEKVFTVNIGATAPAGNVYFVSTAGNDANDGSYDHPWATLQYAVDTIAVGDTIVVEPGNYVGCRIESSGTALAPKTIMSETPWAAVINDKQPTRAKHGSYLEVENFAGPIQYWVVDGFEVSGGGVSRYCVDVRACDHITVQNCNAHNANRTGIFCGHVDYYYVLNNLTYSNGEHGIYTSDSGDYGIVRGNTMHNNVGLGHHMNGGVDDGGDGTMSNWVIEKNTSYSNVNGFDADGVETSVWKNNLAYNNSSKGIQFTGGDGTANGAVCSRNDRILNNTLIVPAGGFYAFNIAYSYTNTPAPVGNQLFNNVLYTYNGAGNRGSIDIVSEAIPGFASDYNVVMGKFGMDDNATQYTLSQWQGLGYDLHSVYLAQGSDTTLFVNPSGSDWHLKSGSAAIDAGTCMSPDVIDDIDGVSRPQGAKWDIGCYEYVSGKVAVNIETASLPDGTVDVAYSQNLAASGGAAPYTWSITGGTLPAGLSLDGASGVISGTPTNTGVSNFTVLLTDAATPTAGTDEQALSINIVALPLQITTPWLRGGYTGARYSQHLSTTGGVAPLTWSIFSGALPTGVSIGAATGEISGTPSATGTFTFTVHVEDSQASPMTAEKSFTVAMTAAPAGYDPYYVSSTGSDSNNGAFDQPWGTLQYAVDHCPAGGTVFVEPGTYIGFRVENSGTAAQPKAILSETPGAAIVNAKHPTRAKHGSYVEVEKYNDTGNDTISYWTIDGFTVHGLDTSTYGIDVRVTSHITIVNNFVDHAARTGIHAPFSDYVFIDNNTCFSTGEHGIYVTNSSDYGVCSRNTLYGNPGCGIHMNGDASSGGDGIMSGWVIEKNIAYSNANGYDADGVDTSVWRNNLAYANSSKGIQVAGADGAVWSRNDRFVNNTLVCPAGGFYPLNFYCDSTSKPLPTGNRVFNNILFSYNDYSGRGSMCVNSYMLTDFQSDYNVVMNWFGIDDNATTQQLTQWRTRGYDAHSVQTTTTSDTALWVDPVNATVALRDFHLKAGSVAIDHGTTLTDVTDDITGMSRPQGSAYDIGAYEVAVAGPATLSITTTSMVSGLVGSAYSLKLSATGGVTPYTWSLASGALPAGIGIDRYAGWIAGTPTASGTSNFTVRVTDSRSPAVTATKAFSITISAATTYEVVFQNGLNGYTAWQDTWITSDYPTTNYQSEWGDHLQYNTPDGQLHKFDVSSIPANAIISSAVLSLYVTNTYGGTANAGAYRSITAWNVAQATWNNRQSGTPWATPGGLAGTDYEAAPYASSGDVSVVGWINFDISDLLSKWVNGTYPNQGIRFKLISGGHLYTRMADYVTDPSLRPKLSINYTVPGGNPVTITTTYLDNGTPTVPYSQTLAATGGTAPYTWSLSGGSLPAGLSLTSAGVISGTPTATGTAAFTVKVLDSVHAVATKALSISIVESLISITTTTLPGSLVGDAYSETVVCTGGTAPYAWSIVSGTLPAGVSLDSATGVISGTPTTYGTSSFTIQVIDSQTPAASAQRGLSITVDPTHVTITTTSLAGGTIGSAYSQTVTAIAGTLPYTWSVFAGALPAGLSLDAATGAITGTPTAQGTANFTIRVTDSTTPTPVTDDKGLSIAISGGATYQFAASDAETSTTNTNYVGKVSMTLDTLVADDWIIFGFCEFKCPNPAYATFVQLFIDGAGEGQNTRKPVDPTDYLPFISVKVKNLAPGAHTVQLKYRAGNSAAAAYVRNARVCAVRKANLEFWNVANDNAKPLSINSTDIAVLTWTPALQGNYLVISTAELNATTTVSTDLQTLYNGVVNDEGIMRAADNGDYTTFMSFNYCANAPAGVPITHKITGRKMASSPINHYIRRARILALRLSQSRFNNTAAGYGTEQNTTSTAWQQCLTTSWTYGVSGNWLFLNSARVNNSSTSYQTGVRVQLNNTATCGDQLMMPKDTTDLLNFSSIDVRNLTTSRMVDMDWRTTNAAGTAKVKRLRFYGLPLDAQ